jgi:hypothetical protein
MIDWRQMLYDKLYDQFGQDAIIVTSDGYRYAMQAILKISGAEISTQGHLSRQSVSPGVIETQGVQPAAFVRAADIARHRLTDTDVIGGEIVIRGKTWRIDSRREKPAPDGGDGEWVLLLSDEGGQ